MKRLSRSMSFWLLLIFFVMDGVWYDAFFTGFFIVYFRIYNFLQKYFIKIKEHIFWNRVDKNTWW